MLKRKCPVCKKESLVYNLTQVKCDECELYIKKLTTIERIIYWSSTRWWLWRVPILAWFIFLLYQNWNNPQSTMNRGLNPIYQFDFGVHELGHILFIPFGEYMHILGGSLWQCLFPIICLIALWQIRWYFASALSFCWIGLNLFDVAIYAADARARMLDLATGPLGAFTPDTPESYNSSHDWYQLLLRINHLDWDLTIAHWLRVTGAVLYIFGLIFAVVIIFIGIQSQINRYLHHNKTVSTK